MRGATFFLAAAVLVGLVTSSARATDPHSQRLGDARISVQTIAHPGTHHGHHGYHTPGYGRHGYSPGYHYGARPYVVHPPIYVRPPVVVPYPPVYSYPHVCGPHCGPRCRHAYPYDSFYYRGNGWGFSFSF
ncbi:MAG: hypothetical protein MUF25_16955 [Pirellulaceae bacterium]|jgi:hypothetical protein|nr:hypothetical protein [Pirellulaceae bacterium]